MLKLNVKIPGTQISQVHFNPFTMKLTDDPRMYTTHTPIKIHTATPKVLKILLGDACNFRCKYCRQDHHSKKEPINHVQLNHVQLNNFIFMLKDYLDFSQLERIEYWGGEPLLYWEEIVYLSDRLELHYMITNHEKLNYRPLVHHITTNGSLLTKEIVEDIKAHAFLFKLSHDGPGQELRTMDPLTLHEDLIMQIYEDMKSRHDSQFTINSVLTKLCPSPLKIVNWFRERFDDDIRITKIEPVIPYNDDALKYAIGHDDLAKFSDTIRDDILEGTVMKHVIEYQELWKMFNHLYHSPDYVYNMTEAKCHANQVMTICTDLNGNLTPCQVYDEYTPDVIIGHLTKMHQIKEQIPYAPISRVKCAQCPVISLCRGVCPHIAPGEYADTNCAMRYHTYWGILRAFIEKATGIKVLSINELPTTTEGNSNVEN